MPPQPQGASKRRPALTARRAALLRELAEFADGEVQALAELYERAQRKRPRRVKEAAAYLRQLCRWHEQKRQEVSAPRMGP